MRKNIYFTWLFTIFFLAIFISACSSKKGTETFESNNNAAIDQRDDEVTKTVFDFLYWYKANMSRLAEIEMVINSGNDGTDTTKLYAVNFTGTEEYLSELLKSQFISEKYVEKQRKYFKQCEIDFKNEPQYEGPPMGFDYDLIMLSQDYDLDQLNQVKSISHKGTENTNQLILQFPYSYILEYSLSKVDGKWLIDDIQNVTAR